MSATTGLNIDSFDVYDSDGVSWHDTSLIQVESVLLLGSFFVLEVFRDGVSLKDYFVGLVLDLHLFLLSD